MPELLTSSRLRCFRDCARKHQLMYVEGWRPVVDAEALRFGTLIHSALEAYWLALSEGQINSTIIDPRANTETFVAAALAKHADPFERIRAETMMEFYVARWHESDFTGYDVLAVEAQFEAPLINPETMAHSRTWALAGKVDVILCRRSDGRVLIMEHKSSSEDVEGDDADYWTKLAIDPQLSCYVVGAESLNWPVDECLYDVLVKPRQRPLKATPIENRKFKADGSLYANQRAHDETPDEYRERLRAAMAETPDRWCVRKPIPRAESQIADFLADAWQQAGVMRDAARLGRSARNVDACHRYGRCPYWLLCASGGKAEDYPSEYRKVENVNPELETA